MIFILAGAVGSGKTTFLRGLIDEGRTSGIPFDGFISPRVMALAENSGYDLLDIKDGRTRPFLRRTGNGPMQTIGPYFVLPDGLALANEIICGSKADDLLVVDEIGPLELGGQGFWPALKDVLFDPRRRSLVVIRDTLVEEYQKLFASILVEIFRENDRPELRKRLLETGGFPIKIKFFAYFREMFGAKEKDVNTAGGSTLRRVLERLADTPARRAELFAGQELKPHIVVMINGTPLSLATGLETDLKSGDVIAIFPLMGGG